MDPPAFHPPRWDSIEHLSHCATLASGLRRTSKVNWGAHKATSYPPPSSGSYSNSYDILSKFTLGGQEKRHTCHQLSRHKGQGMQQLDNGDKGTREILNLAAKGVLSTNPRTPTLKKLELVFTTRSQLICEIWFPHLWSYCRASDIKGWEVPTIFHLWELKGCIYSINGSRVCSYTSVNWVKFSFSFSGFQNKIKYKAISNPIYTVLRNLSLKQFSWYCLHVYRLTQKPLAASLVMPWPFPC